MAAIVATIVTAFTRFFAFLKTLWGLLATFIEAVWAASMVALDVTVAALSSVLVFAATFLVDALVLLITIALSILPAMPQSPAGASDFSMLGQANRYIPVSEVAAFTAVWGTIFGAIAAYKLAKFIRGAG